MIINTNLEAVMMLRKVFSLLLMAVLCLIPMTTYAQNQSTENMKKAEELVLQAGGGGSDANILNARGIAAVPISTGMAGVHTTDEHVAVDDMVRCAELVLHTLGLPNRE